MGVKMQRIEKLLKFKIMGEVKAKQSVKFANIGGFMRKYTPADVTNYANWVKISFQKEHPTHLPSIFAGYYLEVKIFVYMKVPASFSNKKRELALNGYLRPDKKPDWDNISKNICDALNGIVWPDDKAIVDGEFHKLYAETDYTVVVIRAYKYAE